MLVNGKPQNFLDLADRALHYGDGAFETVRIENGRPRHWARHLLRLSKACEFLRIPINFNLLNDEVEVILDGLDDVRILKILITRGSGGRGYRPPENAQASRILSLHPLPSDYSTYEHAGIRLMRCQHPVSENPALAGLKHLNRLDQVLASMELSADCQEGLMLTSTGKVIEGTRTNLFIAVNGKFVTPTLATAGVAGIQREIILECCKYSGIDVTMRDMELAELAKAREIFVCNSVLGIWPVIEWRDGQERHHLEPGPLTRLVQELTRRAD